MAIRLNGAGMTGKFTRCRKEGGYRSVIDTLVTKKKRNFEVSDNEINVRRQNGKRFKFSFSTFRKRLS